MTAFNNPSSQNNIQVVRHQTRYQAEAALDTDTVFFANTSPETLIESQREGKHGIKKHQLLDTVFNTVFLERMSMDLVGLHRTLKAEKPLRYRAFVGRYRI